MKQQVYRVFTLLLFCILQTAACLKAGETGSREKDLFITGRISNDKPFTGETVELTYTLFFKGIAPKILDIAKPSHKGIWAEETASLKLMPSKPEKIGNTLYRSAVIKRMTLIPLQPGRLGINGYRVLCITPKNMSTGTGPEPGDSLRLSAPSVTMDVVPLPEPKPPGFRGAVGRFSVAASVQKDTVQEGSSLRLTAVITGNGGLFSLPDIPLSLPEGFSRIDASTTHIPGDKTEPLSESLKKTVTLKAKQQGTFTFSPLSFTAFDPKRKIYTAVAADNLTLTVLPVDENETAERIESTRNAPQPENIPENRQTTPLYHLLFALPFALILSLLYLLLKKRPSRNLAPEPAHSPQEFRKQLFTAIKLSCGFEPEKHSRSELTDVLKKQEIDENDLRKLLALLDELDRLEFAPGGQNKEKLKNLRQECETLSAILRSRPSG